MNEMIMHYTWWWPQFLWGMTMPAFGIWRIYEFLVGINDVAF